MHNQNASAAPIKISPITSFSNLFEAALETKAPSVITSATAITNNTSTPENELNCTLVVNNLIAEIPPAANAQNINTPKRRRGLIEEPIITGKSGKTTKASAQS